MNTSDHDLLVQVRMLGSGRPFLIEIQNARLSPSDTSICEIERRINCLESRHVRCVAHSLPFLLFRPRYLLKPLTHCCAQVMVKNLKVLGSEAWNLMREGEAEKQVIYSFSYVVVWLHIFLVVFYLSFLSCAFHVETICGFSLDFSLSQG